MPAPVNVYSASASAVTDGGTAETVVLTLGPLNVDTVQHTVSIFGQLNITPGTSAVSCVIKIRRNTVSGTQVGTTETALTVATDNISVPFSGIDTPGEQAGIKYVVTVAEGSAAADGTVNVVGATAIVSQ